MSYVLAPHASAHALQPVTPMQLVADVVVKQQLASQCDGRRLLVVTQADVHEWADEVLAYTPPWGGLVPCTSGSTRCADYAATCSSSWNGWAFETTEHGARVMTR